MCRFQRPKSFHEPMSSMQPCSNDFVLSGTSRAASKLKNSPRPSHVRHMPLGLLKLNSCGVGSSKLMPQSVQAKWEERTMSPGWVPAARRLEEAGDEERGASISEASSGSSSV